MKQTKFLLLILLLLLLLPHKIVAQDSTIILDGRKYVFENNQWFAEDNNGEKFKLAPESFTVKLKPNVPMIALENVCNARGIEIERVNRLGFIDLKLPANACFHTAYTSFLNLGLFESIDVNTYAKLHIEPNDPGAWNQYYLFDWLGNGYPHANVRDAWDTETGSTNPVIVAVIDVGVDFNNQDLINNELGWDYVDVDNDPNPRDNDNHGTIMSGIIAAKTNNDTAVAGIAGGWGDNYGTVIMALRVGIQEYDGFIIDKIDDAIIFAVNNGAKVINMSFGNIITNQAMEVAIVYAYNQGCFLVASVGNTGQPVTFPASHPLVVAVSGILKDWTHYGNKGEEIDVIQHRQKIFTRS
ncbi:MAG: S8 family serine peptidase [Bacteroidetes bacterium]|nr:S8 family serine peptidase [Bacteroidota bacterium]